LQITGQLSNNTVSAGSKDAKAQKASPEAPEQKNSLQEAASRVLPDWLLRQ
jgi:hypothetical protein